MRKLRMETELYGVPLVVVGYSYGSPPHEVEIDSILHREEDIADLLLASAEDELLYQFEEHAREMWEADACERQDNLREERRLEREFV